jgi:DNA-binding NarL/FixJ family response regulator
VDDRERARGWMDPREPSYGNGARRGEAKRLTPRQLELLRSIARGLRNQQIAEQLGITVGTVRVHLHTVCRKLGTTSRLEVLAWARGSAEVSGAAFCRRSTSLICHAGRNGDSTTRAPS